MRTPVCLRTPSSSTSPTPESSGCPPWRRGGTRPRRLRPPAIEWRGPRGAGAPPRPPPDPGEEEHREVPVREEPCVVELAVVDELDQVIPGHRQDHEGKRRADLVPPDERP